jgi:4-amino-4-deoxy-L-arabinose transferase-like glycosyltransferase
MPDILFLALFTWSLFFFIDYFKYYSNKSLVVSSLLLGLSALTKPVGIIFITLSFLSIFVWFILKRREVIKGIQASLIIFSIFSTILSPWVIRNFITFGEFGISTIFGTNLFDYNYRYMLKSKFPNTEDAQLNFENNFLEKRKSILQVLTKEQRLNPMIVSDKLGSFARGEILSNFTEYIEIVAKRHPRLYFGTGTIALFNLLGDNHTVNEMKQFVLGKIKWNALPMRAQIVQSVSWSILIILYTFAFFGGMRLIFKKNWFPLCILLSICAYFTILIGPIPLTRYRIMLLPSLSILGAYGLFSLIKKK